MLNGSTAHFSLTEGSVSAITRFLDNHAGDWTAAVRALVPGGADAVLEAYGGETKLQAPRALRDGGRIVWITGEPAPQLDRGIVGANVHGLPRRDTLEALTDLIDRGQLRPPSNTSTNSVMRRPRTSALQMGTCEASSSSKSRPRWSISAALAPGRYSAPTARSPAECRRRGCLRRHAPGR